MTKCAGCWFQPIRMPLAILVMVNLVTGCEDPPPPASKQQTESKEAVDAGDMRRITWLESTDKVKPELWLAALQSGASQPDAELVSRLRKLLVLASTEYLESPRMVANRTAQLVAMLREVGQTEGHEQVLQDLLSLPKTGTTGNARTMSAVVAQYVNLRRSGMDRMAALNALRDGQPAVSLEALGEARVAPAGAPTEAPAPQSVEGEPERGRVDLGSIQVSTLLKPDEVREFVEMAAKVTPYEASGDVPRIARISGDEISRVLCGGQKCSAVAFFDDRSRTVYVDERLDLEKNLIARSFVVHEVVHFFHLLDGRLTPGMNCRARLVLEQEAYRAQNQYLAEEGSQHRVSTRLLRSLCRGG